LYSLLHLAGVVRLGADGKPTGQAAVSLDDIKTFRELDSVCPGHPEHGVTTGVETTTGPLGQGLANGVGMAIAEAHLRGRYNQEGHEVVDHRTWVIASDGDLMEGVASEAASLAGHLKLGRLVVLYDNNSVTLSAATDMTFSEDRAMRFRSYGWQTIDVEDGNDIAEINRALDAAVADITRPTLILVKTHLGFGSPKVDSFKAHGSPLGVEDAKATKVKLGWPAEPPFYVPDAALARFREAVTKGEKLEADWHQRMQAYAKAYPDLARELDDRGNDKLADGWDADIPVFEADAKGIATRVAGGKVMNAIAPKVPALFGGSADLDPSTNTALKGLGDFNPPVIEGQNTEGIDAMGWSYEGRNLHYGVREHAMGAIVNGLSAHGGFIGYGSTFLIFSDYMRPPIRLAALMGLHVVHIFTHDSLALGEDGPTHQPIEQLASLRAIPKLTLLRPGDANEAAVAWKVAIETLNRPVLLAMTRQNLPTLDRTKFASAEGVRKGAYVLRDAADGKPSIVLMASGSEVHLIVEAADQLAAQGVAVRCVSMPSWDLFEMQPQSYKDSVFPPTVKARLAVELGVEQGWSRYTGDGGNMIAITDRFGASAPAKVLLEQYGFTVDNVVARAKKLLGLE
ncbi:MAG: transketolase, partial [Rhizobacter sp.]|nr:transketolase [Rhizobacter sp.]